MKNEQIISKIKAVQKPDFDKMELLKSYPEPVSRYLRYHLPGGIPNRNFAKVQLKGIIKIVNWSFFKSTLYANPFCGFFWSATIKMGILPVKGFDYFCHGEGAMQWDILNLIPVMKGKGYDISQSAEGRAKMESAFFADLLIHPKVKWEVISENEITASWKINQEEQPVHFKIGDDGSLNEIFMLRWGNPGETKDFKYHTFGSSIESEIENGGIIVPQKGNAGWWFGEKKYDDGEFYRFEVF